jgi:hypothetical protein
MSRWILTLPVLSTIAGIGLAACSDTTLGTFSVVEPLPEVAVPSIGIAIAVPPVTIELPSDITAQEELANGDYDFLTSARPRRLDLWITDSSEDPSRDSLEDGSMDDFDFLSMLEVHISAELNGQTSRTLVASVPEGDPQYGSGSRMLSLTLEDVDVLDFVEAPGGYSLSVTLSGNSPPDTIFIAGEVRFRVGVGFR